MSAESKQAIVDRLNRNGRLPMPQLQPRRLGGPPVPGAFDPMVLKQPMGPDYDPSNPSLFIQATQRIPFKDFFQRTPTQQLYDIRQVIDNILGTRPDAKR